MNNFSINKKLNPKGLKKDEYDVIIIGAGIGGLVCGCYLAKAGMKVLIVEQHSKVGGYCTSFIRDGFTFDGGIHALEGCGPNGILGKVFSDLELNSALEIMRVDPCDILMTPFGKFYIRNDINATIDGLKEKFPDCKDEIQDFFSLLLKKDFVSKYIDYRNKTFAELSESYFSNKYLKIIFSMLLLNIGLSHKRLAAINGLIFLNQYLSDGGYYPRGECKQFLMLFLKSFSPLGGKYY